MARRSKRSYRLAALKGWRTRRANARTKKKRGLSKPTKRTTKRKTGRASKKMWRVTIGAAYEIRAAKKKNKKGDSPEHASYMVRAWYSSITEAVSEQDDLEERALAGRDSYEDETPRAFHRDNEEEVNVAIEAVDYDERFIDIIEETNER